MLACLTACLSIQAGQCEQVASNDRVPNVIIVLTDDQGYGDVAAHGNTMIKTPHLDRLHGQSIRLTDFHVDPTCSPTRSALMTGRYSARVGVWHTIMGRSLLRRDEMTMGNVFAASGYRTAMFGKWHLGDNAPFRPADRGFEHVLRHGGGGVGQTPDYWGNDYFDDTYWLDGTPTKYEGYCTDIWFDGAMDFIEKSRDEPFFVYLATNTPHGPLNVDEKYSRPYEEAGVPKSMAAFYGMITNIDENMGRLVARLDRLGLTENTLLIFMTDNGTATGMARGKAPKNATGKPSWTGFNDGMRGTKGSQYDGGHRVPCFWHWPAGGLTGPRDVDQLTAHVDMMPTLIDLLDLKQPKEVAFDGKSLVPLLRGKGDKWDDRTLVAEVNRTEIPQPWQRMTVMTEQWRLVNGSELYDIQADHGQTTDLADKHPEVVAQLRAAYERRWESVSERFDEFCPIVVGSDAENPAWITCHDWHSGQVPWNQRAVQSLPLANGSWAIDVERAGRYRVTLLHRPRDEPIPLKAVRAKVLIGRLVATAEIPAGATEVSVEMELSAGETKMQTYLEQADGKSRGAFFVEVERL